MALKITEVDGKLVLEGTMNSVTSRFLKEHIQIVNSSILRGQKNSDIDLAVMPHRNSIELDIL